MCERCGAELSRKADCGGVLLTECTVCGHAQFMRAQVPRGSRVTAGIVEELVAVAGEIDGR